MEKVEPVVAGTTLREAYLAASAKHFPFNGRTPAELLFAKPQWNNWIEIAIQGMRQTSVDAYTEALARSGFPCGVYIMDGGWLSHNGSYRFHAPDFPDPRGMLRRIREKAEVMPRCTSRGLSARHGRSRSGVRAGPSMSR